MANLLIRKALEIKSKLSRRQYVKICQLKWSPINSKLHKKFIYSHLSNNRGGWNKRGGSTKVGKSINVEVGINVEGGIFWKKLVHKCNKRGVEGGKNLRNQ